MDEELLEDMYNDIKDMKRDINDIQGDVSILSNVNKERHRDDIINLAESRFGRSKNKRRCWYYANGDRTPEDLADVADMPIGSVYQCVADLNRDGLLIKDETADTVYYDKSAITEDIGLENKIEQEIDDL